MLFYARAQTQHALELEALRLSLTNLHTAQLELTQTNLQKEKEAALSELQASLREKWAQESAMLQTRQQFELERLREQSRGLEKQAEIQLQLALGTARKYTAQLYIYIHILQIRFFSVSEVSELIAIILHATDLIRFVLKKKHFKKINLLIKYILKRDKFEGKSYPCFSVVNIWTSKIRNKALKINK